MHIVVGDSRLTKQLEHLAGFSDAPAPAVTRILFSGQDLNARAYLKTLAEEIGLDIREDALGNTYFRWQGETDLPAVATGSHIDAIPFSGKYDGTVGVLGGLEALRALKTSGFTPKRSLELILFTAEEPTRFGIGCLGSRAMAGMLSPEDILALRDDSGQNPDELRRALGFEGELADVARADDDYYAFLELHIEQMPALEKSNIPIGIVTAIAAPATLTFTFSGDGGHAGAKLMPERSDALLAAAELSLRIETIAKNTGSPDSVATVGKVEVHPGAVNSIPSKVFMTADVRDTELGRRDGMVQAIKQAAQEAASLRQLELAVDVLNADPPATCAPQVVAALETAASAYGYDTLHMVSRAYHDALFMARLCPTGMVFIPCKDGISHTPEEYARPEAIAKGVQVLAATLAQLSLEV